MHILKRSDWPQIKDLYRQSKQELSNIGGFVWPLKNFKYSLGTKSLFGLSCRGQLMSLVSYREELFSLEIDYLYTGLKFRGKGYMSSIFSNLANISQQKHKPIWLEVSRNNLSAIKFYKKMGLKNVGRRNKYYKNGQDALIYSLST